MSANQYGGALMGGVALQSNGLAVQNFQNVPPGAIAALDWMISFSAKSSGGSSFTAVVSNAAAEGTDDLDLVLAALFGNISLWWDQNNNAGNITLAQWRTVLGVLNRHDFAGNFTNGATIPGSGSSATKFRITIRFPVSLAWYFFDGGMFQNGSARIQGGRLEINGGATLASTTDVAGLANASTATCNVSGVTVSLFAQLGPGTAGDTGPLWQVQRPAGLQTSQLLDGRLRVFVADVLPVASSVTNLYNVGPYKNVSPQVLSDKYVLEQETVGGYDITARCAPLYWINEHRHFSDFTADVSLGNILLEAVSTTASTLTIYDVSIIPVDGVTQAAAAQQISAGGPVTVSHPTTRSMPPGTPFPSLLSSLTPSRVTPGVATPGAGTATVQASPADAGIAQSNRMSTTAVGGGQVRRFNRSR